MDLDPSVVWDFAGTLVGTLRERPRQLPATVSRVDPDGTVWLSMPGADGLVPASTTADVQADDSVTVEWWGNAYHVTGNGTSPSIGTRAASALRRATAAAAKVAGDARSIADAVGQHFWADDNGVHVSNEDGNATGERNILMNSLGILLRKGSAWLASFSDSAVAFYDGLGNAAENIVARFGTDGAAIGSVTSSRLELTETLIRLVSSDQLPVFDIDTTGSTNVVRVEFNPTPYSDYSMSSSTTASETIDAALFESGTQISFAPPSGVLLTLDHTSTLNPGQYDISSVSVTGSGASLSVTMDGSKVIIGCADMTMTAGTPATYTGTVSGIKFEMTSHLQQRVHHATVDYTFTVAYDGGSIIITHAFDVVWEDGRPAGPAIRVKASYTHVTAYANVGAPIYSLGTRSGFDEVGDFSAIIGESLTAAGDNQTAIGKYNANSSANAFEVGNGTADDARSNAFSVGWDGTVNTATPIPKASGGTGQTGIARSTVTLSGCTVSGQRCWHNGVTCSVTMIDVKLSSALGNGNSIAFGTIPSGYRPSEILYGVASSPNATFCGRLVFRIDQNGQLSLVNRSGSNLPANTAFSLFVTYAV